MSLPIAPSLPNVRLAKLRPPRLPDDLAPRPRLTAALAEVWRQPVTYITATAGFGKTTALAEVAQRHQPTVWYALDARDRDLRVLLAHLGWALHLAAPGAGERLQTLGQSPTPPLESAIAAVAADLEAIAPVCLILDDVHALGARSPAARLLGEIVARPPLDTHLILASRRPAPWSLARSRAIGDTIEIGADHLTIDRASIAAWLARPDDDLADQLWRQTAGWPVALRLTKRLLDQTPALGRFVKRGPAPSEFSALFAYLAEEVMAQFSRPDRDALEAAAILEPIRPDGLAALLGQPMAERAWTALHLLPGLARLAETPEPTIDMHQLLRDFLLAHLGQRDPDRLARLRRAAASHAEQTGDWLAAFDAYLAVGDVAALTRLARERGATLLASGQFTALLGWLEALPAAHQDPQLLMLRGEALTSRGEFDAARVTYDSCARNAQRLGDRSRWALAIGSSARLFELQGRFAEAGQQWEAALAEIADASDAAGVRATLSLGVANTLLAKGEWRRAIELNEAALKLSEAEGVDARIAMAAHNLGYCYFHLGDFGAARAWYDAAIAIKRRRELSASLAYTLNNLALLLHAQGETAAARETLAETFDLTTRLNLDVLASYARCNLADIERDGGALDLARELYRQALVEKERWSDSFGQAYAWSGLADLEILAGAPTEALTLAERALEARRRVAGAAESLLLQGGLGRALLANGRLADAEPMLSRVTAGLRRLGARFWLVGALVDLAAARQPNRRRGRQSLAEAQAIAESGGLAAALARAQRRELAYTAAIGARSVEKLTASAPPIGPPADSGAPWRVTTFGGLAIEIDGEPTPNDVWRRRRARTLFIALLLAGPAGGRREQLMAALWPDAPNDRAESLFYAHLRALREALANRSDGSEREVVRYAAGRYVLAAPIWWDVAEFRRLVATADAKANADAEIVVALDLYRGDLLPEPLFADESWLAALREQTRSDALRLANRRAESLFASGDFDRAGAAWRRALDLDPLHESSHRGLIRTHLALGQRADAEARYRLCQDILRRELGVDPAPETRRLLWPNTSSSAPVADRVQLG